MDIERQNTILKIFEEYGYDKSLEENLPVDKNGNYIAWYTYPAIEYLNSIDFSNAEVFEFGSGSSSIWWAKNAKSVCSVEGNIDWFNKINSFNFPNKKMFYREDRLSYCKCILEQNMQFDIVVIDGKYRLDCIENSLKSLKDNGLLIFDNSDRSILFEHYKMALEILSKEDFIQVDFKGFSPLNVYTQTTSLFFRKNFNFAKKNLHSSTLPIGSCQEIKNKK